MDRPERVQDDASPTTGAELTRQAIAELAAGRGARFDSVEVLMAELTAED